MGETVSLFRQNGAAVSNRNKIGNRMLFRGNVETLVKMELCYFAQPYQILNHFLLMSRNSSAFFSNSVFHSFLYRPSLNDSS